MFLSSICVSYDIILCFNAVERALAETQHGISGNS